MLRAKYIPILRTRQNERLAVSDLTDDVREITAPLFDITSPDDEKDYDDAVAYVERNINQLAMRLSGYPEMLLDSSILDAEFRLTGSIHPLSHAGGKLLDAGVSVTPVSGLARDQAHWSAALSIAERHQHKQLCLRLENDDLKLPTDTANAVLNLKQNLLSDIEVIVLYDCENIFDDDVLIAVKRIQQLSKNISNLVSDLSIVAGSGIPKSIREVAAIGESVYLDRKEIELWSQTKSLLGEMGQYVLFGDYATINPEYEMLDPKLTYRVTAPKIIYTLPKSWFVIRGTRLHDDGPLQYFDLAANVVALPEFRGANYSMGDSHIYDKANRVGNPGRPGTWVRPCLSHHLTLTARETIL